jgi:hypothetical protein
MTISQSFCIEQQIENIVDECVHSISMGINSFIYLTGSLPKCLARARTANHRNLYRLAIFMRVLDLVHAAQSSPNPVTQRDIFYKDVVLFKTQSTSDQAIIRLAKLLGVSREVMNIVKEHYSFF